ncbi:putative nuclease HARBI1 [Dermacentor albipictus]|uniref:putative nuclease HARBI1 n=1 Tax=Dermacentor albipictus TaxID=60249 RepID=UPI0031FC2A59
MWLCEQLSDDLAREREGLTVQDQVICALRFYATGGFQTAVGSEATVSLSQPSVSRCVRAVSEAIACVGTEQRWVSFPRTRSEIALVKQGFLRSGNISDVVGCVDGTYIAIAGPDLPPAEKQTYWCRKGYYALNTMVVCDSNMRVLAIDPRFAGSCHDAYVWRGSALRSIFADTEIVHRGEFLLGDSAYPLEPWLITPVPGHPALSSPEGRFNQAHASMRSVVERCIGLMKSRFRCLQRYRALQYCPAVAEKIVAACAALHNLCLDASEPLLDDDSNIAGEDDDDDDDDALPSDDGGPTRGGRTLYARGKATRDRQIALYGISRNAHLLHIQRARRRAQRHALDS